MATAAFSGVLWQIRRSAFRADGATRSDGELLDRFRTNRDEDAFAALVTRHGPMVFGVCRRTLRNEADAEDAFQATFLVLARRAHAVQPSGRVGHWLYGVACNTARKARVMNRRRMRRERRAGEARLGESVPSDDRELIHVLDQELSRLPEIFRAAVVLCDLEGSSLQEAARRLDCPIGTVASRLARARIMLKQKIARRGLALSALLVPGVASARVPAQLAMQSTRAAIGTAPISTTVSQLTEGVIQAMFVSKVKFVLAAVVAAGVLVAGIGNGSALLRADPDKPAKPGADPTKPVKPATDPTKPGADPVKPVKPGADPAKPVKPEGVKTPGMNGTIKAINADKGTLTITMPSKGGGTREETVATDKETKVSIEGKQAKFGDLKVGQPVGVKLTPDRATAIGISVDGQTLVGELKAIDAAKHTVQIKVTTHPDPADKTKTATEDKSLKLADEVKVAVDGSKKATVADLKVGASVQVHLSVDGERVLAIVSPVKAAGPTVSGELKAVAKDNKSIQVAVTFLAIKGDKSSAKTEERTIKLADELKIAVEGKKPAALADLKAGSNVTIYLSPDGERAIAITASSKGEKKPEKPTKPGTDPAKPVKPVKPDTVKPGVDKPKSEKPVK